MNPFCSNPAFKIKTIEVYKTNILVPKKSIDFEERAILSYKKDVSIYQIETQSHVKFYDTFNDHVYFFKEFKPSTRDVFMYILLRIQENVDWIELKQKNVETITGLSKSSFYMAIKQLKEYLVIADKSCNVYWVNPFYVFKGNRLAFYQQKYSNQIEVVAKKEIEDN